MVSVCTDFLLSHLLLHANAGKTPADALELQSLIFASAVLVLDLFKCPLVYLGGVDAVRGYICFFIGMAVAYASSKIYTAKKLFQANALMSIFAVLTFLLRVRSVYLIVTLFAIMVFDLLVMERLFYFRFPEKLQAFICFLNAVSFEVYVMHVPFLMILNLVRKLSGIEYTRNAITMILFILLTEVLSAVIYKCIDIPCSKLISKIQR